MKKLTGKVASEGAEQLESIAAVIKVVHSTDEIGKIEFGDAIVAQKISPAFAPILKKAKAIIVEEGGATSHAVLLSREHGLPCLINVTGATTKLKDNSLVEINLKEGFIATLTKVEYDILLEQEKELVQTRVTETEDRIRTQTEQELVTKHDSVLWFKDITKKDVGIVGGKGASLGEMSSRFPIPGGFCITAQAYEKEVANIQDELMKKLKIDINDPKQLEKASKEIEKLILATKMNKELEKEIITNYEKLANHTAPNTPFVAVRSSATAEDLPEASFAGQQATLLNVKGNAEVIKAVKECWASLFTERAIYYREINNFKHEDVLISVVVQQMVDSEKAGVMFTVNPVTKNYDELLIEGSFGLGETVVSGQITPDSFFIDKKKLDIKQRNVAEKTWGLFRDRENEKGGNVRKEIDNPNEQVLTDAQLKELAKIGIAIEKHYNKPMDIEWAVYKGKIYILQARPITTL